MIFQNKGLIEHTIKIGEKSNFVFACLMQYPWERGEKN